MHINILVELKKIVLLAFALMLLSTTAVVRASKTVSMTQLGANPEAMAGVRAGDWAKYDVNVTWDSNDSEWQPPPSWIDVINNTEYYIITVQMVVGTNITFQALAHFTNGTEQTTTAWMDIITGYGSEGGYHNDFIPANLSAGDDIYFLGKINQTIPCMSAGMIRDTNHLHRTSEASFDGDPNSYNASENYYWDKATGIQTEYAGDYSSLTESYYYLLSMSFKIIETNLWGPPVHNIDTGLGYATIQEAINDNETLDGQTILVDAGAYYEHVVVNKSVTVVGENKITTIIDGNGTGIVVYVTADDVCITGFTIENAGLAYLGSCISLQNSKNTTITDNMISYGDSCIRLNYSRGNKILNNAITNPDHYGIFLRFSSENNIADNNISNVAYGIELHSSENNTINNNIIEGVSYSSINIVSSSGNSLRNNKMMDNSVSGRYFGVWGASLEDYVQDIDTSNTIDGKPIFYLVNQEDTQIPADAGYVGVVNSTNITVRDSTLGNNFQGVLFAYTDNSTIKNVTIPNSEYGIQLLSCNNNTISHSRITGFCGVSLVLSNDTIFISNNVSWTMRSNLDLRSSSNNLIADNILSFSRWGMGAGQGLKISGGSKNIIRGNTLSENTNAGIFIYGSNSNIIYNNLITNNFYGTVVSGENNSFYHNNFINNTMQVLLAPDSLNIWDNGYPSGGNYWSDYNGTDLFSGRDQNETGRDAVGDTEYFIDGNNTDNYPLTGMFSDFNATPDQHVTTICNSTISDFQFNGTAITFDVTGVEGTIGFCRICVPTSLMNATYRVFVNGTEVLSNLLQCSNSTHSYLYFTYDHSTQEVWILPESPTWTSMLLVLTILTVTMVIYKRRLLKAPIH